MSTAVTTFKQQCPGCGANITLKSNLAGKKVDCPKCKFRFVVELPEDSDGDEEVKKPAKGKKSDKAKGKGKDKEKAKAKGKEKDKEAGKKKEKSKMPLILAGVGVLLLLVIGVLIFAFMPSGGSKPPSTTPGGSNTAQGNNQPAGGGQEQANNQGNEDDPATDDLVAKMFKPDERDNAKRQLNEMLFSKDEATRNKAAHALRKAVATNDYVRKFLEDIVNEDKSPAVTALVSGILREVTSQMGDKALTGVKNDPTNLLPDDAQTVLFLDVKKILDSDFSRSIFSLGGYRKEDFQRRTGISVDNIESIVFACNKDHNRIVGLIRTRGLFNWDDVRRTLLVEGDGVTVTSPKGSAGTFYIGKIDFLSEFLSNRMKPIVNLRKRAAIFKLNDYTLVFGDEAAIKAYIEDPPTIKEGVGVVPKQTGDSGGGTKGGGPAAPGASTPGGAGAGVGAATPGGAGAGVGAATPGGAGAGVGAATPGGGGAGVGAQTPGGAGAGVGAATPGGAGAGAATPGGSSGNKADQPSIPTEIRGRFLTVNGALRNIIKMAEEDKESLGMFADSASTKGGNLVDWLLFLKELEQVDAQKIRSYAIAVHKDEHARLKAALQCYTRNDSPSVSKKVEQILTNAAKGELRDLLGFEFAMGPADTPSNTGGQGGGVGTGKGGGGIGPMMPSAPGGPGGGGGMAPSMPPAPGRPGGQGGGMSPSMPPAPGGPGTPAMPPSPGGPGAPMMPGGGRPGTPGGGGNEQPAEKKPESTIEVDRTDEFVTIQIIIRGETAALFEEKIASYFTGSFADSLMQGTLRLGDMKFAYLAYRHTNDKLPYGAFPRPSDAARGGRPYPPNERVSFFPEFLPYLGDDRYFAIKDGINRSKSWRDVDNVKQGRILIPQFLHPEGGPRFVKIRSLDTDMAATHYVGMAGVGPDAAYLPRGHRDAGVFGYDRQTTLEDVRLNDGESYTIMLIQTDKSMVGPWIAGGGYTVRGTSVSGNDVGQPGGFSAPAHKGMQGTWVVMCDGSTRFLKKGVSPTVFKALCTVWGRDDHGEVDLLAPNESLPSRLKTQPVKPSDQKKPKTKIDEEEDEKPAKPGDKK
jgi:flagellar basal body-associated protein FliL